MEGTMKECVRGRRPIIRSSRQPGGGDEIVLAKPITVVGAKPTEVRL